MGYYTQYELTSNDGKIEEHYEALETITGYDKYYMNGSGNECKWYGKFEQMTNYSVLHPTVLFELSGVGEESEDIWTCYFKNGKSQYEKAKIMVAPFDEEKLV